MTNSLDLRLSEPAKQSRAPTLQRTKTKARAVAGPGQYFQLGYRPPYDWDAVLEFLSMRRIAGVEVIEDGEYRRSICLGEQYGLLRVRQDKANHQLICSVSHAPERALLSLTEKLRNMFYLYADPIEISRVLGQEPRLKQSLK